MIITVYISETPYINKIANQLRKEKGFLVASHETYKNISPTYKENILADLTDVSLHRLQDFTDKGMKTIAFIDRETKINSTLLLDEKQQSIFIKDEHTIAGKTRSIQDGYCFLPSEGVQELITRMQEKKDLEEEH